MIAAVVPAAGRSARMGRPKLLVKIQDETVIGRVVSALLQGGVERVIVVAPPGDAPSGPELAAEARRAGAEVVIPETRPAEMRDSIELALETLARGTPPRRVLFLPADTPGITPDVVARLLACAASAPESIVVPCCAGRRGHPIVLPWSLALELRSLPAGLGPNALVARLQHRLVEMPVQNPDLIADLDTPDDLRHWSDRRAEDDFRPEDPRFPDDPTPAHPTGRVQVHVRLFALAKERAGRSEIDLELAASSTVAGLRAALGEHLPTLAPLLRNVLIAVNEEYAGDDAPIPPHARIAVIPPVSGGTGESGGGARVRAKSRRSHRS
jgi:molybdenum cofactor cytidylyltransferase